MDPRSGGPSYSAAAIRIIAQTKELPARSACYAQPSDGCGLQVGLSLTSPETVAPSITYAYHIYAARPLSIQFVRGAFQSVVPIVGTQ